MGTDKRHRPCLRPDTHRDGRHVFLRNDGVFIEWQMDYECGCREEECECYFSSELEPQEVLAVLKDLPYLIQPLLTATWKDEPRVWPEGQFEFPF
jgi:hypothetical protein